MPDTKFKPAYVRIQESIIRRGIDGIYHFTLASNLPSIFRHGGILSRRLRTQLGVAVKTHDWGGKEIELQSYVPCGILPPYPMIYKEDEPVALIRIDPQVLYWHDTLFCPAWSSHRQFNLAYLLNNSSAECFEQLFPNDTTNVPIYRGTEVLIKDGVLLAQIQAIYFRDEKDMDEAFSECSKVIYGRPRVGVVIHFVLRPVAFKTPKEYWDQPIYGTKPGQ